MHLQDRHGRVFDISNHLCVPPSPQGNVTTIMDPPVEAMTISAPSTSDSPLSDPSYTRTPWQKHHDIP